MPGGFLPRTTVREEAWSSGAALAPVGLPPGYGERPARALEIAETLAARPQLLSRYMAITIRQRLSRRIAEGTVLGMALEGITEANMPYLEQG